MTQNNQKLEQKCPKTADVLQTCTDAPQAKVGISRQALGASNGPGYVQH